MHSTVHEHDPEPHEVFLGLGLLITEGRVPGLAARGYGEGPHCSQFVQNNAKVHSCVGDYLCIREENFRKHVGLLWGNNVPLCIEVLLCSECPCGKEKATSNNLGSLPDPAYVLLEQWNIQATTKRGMGESPRSQAGRNLLQAVRSFLHFSQLSAWLSLTKGVEPRNIMYRVTMPGEDFASKFCMNPVDHEFPVANVKNTTIKVLVKSLPRSERIPHILCSNVMCPVRTCGVQVENRQLESPPLDAANPEQLEYESYKSGKRSPMLSESLLDPSPIPRRFQSPSRESPDRLLYIPRPPTSTTTSTASSTMTTIDDRLPTECSFPGKHHCNVMSTQDHDEVQNCSGPFNNNINNNNNNNHHHHNNNKSSNSTRSSRRDLFMQSLANRLSPYPQQQQIQLQQQQEPQQNYRQRFLQHYHQQQQLEAQEHGLLYSSTPKTETAVEPSSSSSSSSSLKQNVPKSNSSSRDVSPASRDVSSDSEDSELRNRTRSIPTLHEKIKFRKSLVSAASMVFHGKTGLITGLPLTSSPAPLRKGQDRFDFDSSLTTPAHIKSAISKNKYQCPPRSSFASQALLGSFEESVLQGRIEPVSTVEGFSAEIGASGSFCPKHLHVPVTVFFYTFCDNDKISTPYLAHINVGRKGYNVPRKGTIQVTLFNPLRTVIKMFVVRYDLSDMPKNSSTFVRQRILYMPLGESDTSSDAQKWLRYLIHLRFATSKSGRMFLHTDLRIVIFRKSDADTSMAFSTSNELRSFTYTPQNPKYSCRFSKSTSSH